MCGYFEANGSVNVVLKSYLFNCGGHFVQQRGVICTILVEGILGNIFEKYLNLDLKPLTQWEQPQTINKQQ